MTGQEKTYTRFLSEVDRVKVYRLKYKGTIVRFSVQHEVLVAGRWRKVVRYDDKHDQPHRHTFYPDGSEYRQKMEEIDSTTAFTVANDLVKKNFVQVRERYILLLDNHGERP